MITIAIVITGLILVIGAILLIMVPMSGTGIEWGLYRWINEHFGRTRAIIALLILALAAFTFSMVDWKYFGGY